MACSTSKKKKKKSPVWQYFDIDDSNSSVVVCKICGANLAYHNSTSAMLNHMRLKHDDKTIGTTAEGRQVPITSFTSPVSRKCDAARTEKITRLIANMTARDMLPLSFVEGDGFKELMHCVEPEYKVPSRKSITTRVEQRYENLATATKEKLEKTEHVAITTDAWTALTTESYMTITCHYIDDWKLQSAVLQTRCLEERHTAQNIADHLTTSTNAWGLQNKVIACVHDNASNVVSANATLLEWESVPCFAHTLQLAINDGFKAASMSRLVGACSRLVAHFHHSSVATNALKEKQRQQNLPEHKLIQCCRTRWNSVCDMFARMQEQRWAVTATLSDRNVTKLTEARTLELTDEHWQTMEHMLPVLHTLKCATTALCSESYVCISMVYPVTSTLLDKHLKTEDGELAKVAEFKTTVAESLRKRMAPADSDRAGRLALIATALDPRHKHLSFLNPVVRESVKENLADHFRALADHRDEGAESEANTDDAPPRKRVMAEAAMATLFGDDYGAEESAIQDELEQYFMEPCIPPNEDPLLWWRKNERRYRKLSRLAKRYLCVPATSVPSERVFSAAGLIVNRLRSRLSPQHVDMLIFLNKNM